MANNFTFAVPFQFFRNEIKMKKEKDQAKNNRFVIQFASLSIGGHNFEFEINDSFFKEFENSEIDNGNFSVKIELLKQSTMLVLDFSAEGITNTLCDRCSENFDLSVQGKNKLIVKLGTDDFEEESDIVSIPLTDSELDVAQYIYEYIILSLPKRRIHPENKKGKSSCNPETLKKLEKILLKEKKKTIDPRWEKLKSLKIK